MNKENDARRLDSADYYKPGDEIVCSMYEEAGGVESSAHDGATEDQRFLRNYSTAIATFAAAYVATIIIALIVSRMWDEDEIRLHVLDALIRVLQLVARICGGWALSCEKAYGDYVNALH